MTNFEQMLDLLAIHGNGYVQKFKDDAIPDYCKCYYVFFPHMTLLVSVTEAPPNTQLPKGVQ